MKSHRVKVRARYAPKEARRGRGVNQPAHLAFEHLNGKYFGELVGAEATRMRRELDLPCREWTTVYLELGFAPKTRKKRARP